MSDFAKLRQDHADLVKMARKLTELTAQPSPPPQLELFELRRQITSTLIGHLKAGTGSSIRD